jgi:ppGpp synthetase/RelA/SpoT-type nucleotidyltranferase
MANKIDQIINDYRSKNKQLEAVADGLVLLLRRLFEVSGIKCHSITYRVKEEESLRRKLTFDGDQYAKLEDVKDLIGLRIITYLEDEIDPISTLIKGEFDIEEMEDKQKLLEPDEFGYTSLHYIGRISKDRQLLGEYKIFIGHRFEIQLRSILQHAWAEIEHDLGYKSKIDPPKDIKRRLFRLAGLLELANAEFTNIHNDVRDYEKNVDQEITDKPQDVLIDAVSIVSFVKNNEEVKTIDSTICSIAKCKSPDFDEGYIASMAKNLKSIGVNNIVDLKAAFNRYKNLIAPFAAVWLKGGSSGLSSGISLYYLCYVMIGSSGSEQKIKDYFLKNQIYSNNLDSDVKKLIDIVNKIKG